MNPINQRSGSLKRAELLSGIGAIVLGMGLGLFFAKYLMAYTTFLILIGLLAHAWGMFDKHRLERSSSSARLWWAEALYWICWGGLLMLALYIAAFRLRS